jgi:acetylornithine deacetylase
VRLEDRVTGEIDRTQDQLIDWLREFIAFQSMPGREGDAQAFIAGTLRDLGASVDVWDIDPKTLRGHPGYIPTELDYAGRPNVVGRFGGTGGGRSLMLEGHVDVVPIEDPTLWRADPWAGQVVEGRMIGRGTSDMKGGLAAMVWAARALRSVTTPRGDLVVASVIEEEASGNGGLAAVLRGHTADAAVVGEPTTLDLVPAHLGVFWFRITVPGVSAHGGYRGRGVNAIEKAMVIYGALQDHEAERNREARTPLLEHLDIPYPISVGTFRAGNWRFTVPDSAVMEGRGAVRLDESIEEAQAAFMAAVDAAADKDPFLRQHRPLVEFVGGSMEPCQIGLDHPFARVASDVLRTLKPDYRVWAKTPATDMRHLMLYGHMPTVIVGPGDDDLAHTANESVAVANVVAAAKFYALLALKWCG